MSDTRHRLSHVEYPCISVDCADRYVGLNPELPLVALGVGSCDCHKPAFLERDGGLAAGRIVNCGDAGVAAAPSEREGVIAAVIRTGRSDGPYCGFGGNREIQRVGA